MFSEVLQLVRSFYTVAKRAAITDNFLQSSLSFSFSLFLSLPLPLSLSLSLSFFLLCIATATIIGLVEGTDER